MAMFDNLYKIVSAQVTISPDQELILIYPESQKSSVFLSMLDKLVAATKYNENQCKIVAFDALSFNHLDFVLSSGIDRYFLIFDEQAQHVLPNYDIKELEWLNIESNHYLLAHDPESLINSNALKKNLWEAMKLKLV